MAFVGPAWNVVLGDISLRLTPDALRGRVSGVQGLVAWGPIPLGSLAGGVLLQWLGGVTDGPRAGRRHGASSPSQPP